jgi:hypothetical protein
MSRTRPALALILLLALAAREAGRPTAAAAVTSGGQDAYDQLVELFGVLRELQEVDVVDWVPDYRPAAMARQYAGVRELAERLGAIDTAAWPLEHQVDYQLVRAEINGLIFYQRVLKPWARDPGFYLQTQDGGGPARAAHLSIRQMPIPAAELDEVRGQLRALPKILAQAETNLTEGAADLAYAALHYMPVEIAYHEMLRDSLAEHHPDLLADAEAAVRAVQGYGEWLAANEHRMTAPAGVGKDNYTWWMNNVQLVPYTWDELYEIIMREDDRILATLALIRNRNKDLPELVPVASQDEHATRRREALLSAMRFMEDNDLFEVPEWADMEGYLAGADGRGESWGAYFTNRYVGSGETGEWPGVRDFFHQTADREPMPEQTHEFIGHYFDRQRQARDTSPIRSTARFYAIDMIRLEGWAFWLEEMMMHAGYLDDRPVRAREVPYWQAAFRTCRAIADLKMHSNEYTLQEAIDYAVDCAPNGWLIPDGPHAWYEMQTNLRYVGWHMGMVVGKLTVNELIAERVRQQGDDFNFRDFFRDFFDAGIMPLSLIRWQMTGLDDEMRRLTDEG